MRLEEILDLKWKDVYIDAVEFPYVEVTNSKNGESRIVPLNAMVVEMLAKLPKRRDHVFLNRRGTDRLRYVRKPLAKALEIANISNFTFHDFRHTFASHFIMNKGDLIALKEILGHKSLAMVQRYAHLAVEHKAKQVNNLSTIFPQSKISFED